MVIASDGWYVLLSPAKSVLLIWMKYTMGGSNSNPVICDEPQVQWKGQILRHPQSLQLLLVHGNTPFPNHLASCQKCYTSKGAGAP